ncbi:protein CURLY FLAG LEAF 1 [Euphorbia lathyris]|uniref:protein CURLY FLAG LEAF 1 n=1 Tax=Euphorbia lathyris TaxID=212925 RepID=UPI00331414DE
MVSLQPSNSPKGTKTTLDLDGSSNNNNKRKWNDDVESFQSEEALFRKRFRSPEVVGATKSFFEIELQLETPLPFEWQRCLDIQSGKIHFYNTRTKKRTSTDPRIRKQEPQQSHHMSLELELNLPCDSQRINKHHFGSSISNFKEQEKSKNEEEDKEKEEEMVASVCERCHLLVMLCKSSPCCPNCKFMHSLDLTFHNNLFKPTLLASCVSYL